MQSEVESGKSVSLTCNAAGLSRATYYRNTKITVVQKTEIPAAISARAISPEEKIIILSRIHEERFIDLAPQEIWAKLMDEGYYYCSLRSFYRILKEVAETRERRNIKRHQNHEKPELIATAPNQVWSWDISKLKGPEKWTYYYLYVAMDIFSRKVVGWMLASAESAHLATKIFRVACRKEMIKQNQLTVHSDRGSSMKSVKLGRLYQSLKIARSLSRPYVSNDNPFSESFFKTLKYGTKYPKRFANIEEGLSLCRQHIDWYNYEHYHTGLALMTPDMVHTGKAKQQNEFRQTVMDQAYARHPERFVMGKPKVLLLPSAVYINPPDPKLVKAEPRGKEEILQG